MDQITLRKLQLTQLEIAREFKRVCEENGIHYFMDGGTLLGAVRHGGFIPWDDDMDFGMLRDEYEKFLVLAPEKLNEKYELISWTAEPMYPNQFAKIIKKGTRCREETRHDDGKNGIYIDLFPYDRFPEERKMQREQGFTLMALRAMVRAKCHTKMWIYHERFHFKSWIKNIPFRFLSLFFSKQQLIERYEREATRFNRQKGDLLFAQGVCKYGSEVVKRAAVETCKPLLFEDTEFSAPADYHTHLTALYGDYMQLPPVDERENRHSFVELSFGEE